MQVWPAIDIRDGKCVRLAQGDYNRETVYGDDPCEMAARWVDQGATCLHLVDLDAARGTHPSGPSLVNLHSIQSIAARFDVTLQVGGGVREHSSIEALVSAGVDRIVIGTRAVTDPEWVRRMAQQFPDRLVIGIDARDGLVATDGWMHTSNDTAIDVAQKFADLPIAGIVYTDIHRDGMLQGPNFDALVELDRAVSADVIASGGIASLDDLRRLAELRLSGAIVGRALYEDQFDLAQAIATASAASELNHETLKPKSVND